MNSEQLRQQAAQMVLILHRSINWDIWGSKRLRYWGILQDTITSKAYTNSLARWLNGVCQAFDIHTPGWNAEDRQYLEVVLNSGQDRALLKLLREETQLIVLMVRVVQQEAREEREPVDGEQKDLYRAEEELQAAFAVADAREIEEEQL